MLIYIQYGSVKDIRLAVDDKGHTKGFAFVEFEQEVRSDAFDVGGSLIDTPTEGSICCFIC